MKKSLIKLWVSFAVAVVGIMGIWVWMQEPRVKQPISQVIEQEELAEVERLNQQEEQLYQQGRYAEAIPFAEKALAIRKNVLGDDHPNVATSMNNLALLYYLQGKYTEAEPLFQQSLAIWKEKLGDNHLDVAKSLNNLALLYESQGRYTEAEPLYQQSLAIRKEKLGDNHPDVAMSLNGLATLYYSQGKYTEAEPLYQQSLAIRKKKLGDNHTDVAVSLNNLAAFYKSQGRYMKAESLYQQSLAIWKEKLGDNHPDVATSLNNLAAFYKSQGRYTEAEPLYQQSLAIRKEKLGDNHPDVAISLNNLAELYSLQGRYTEAEPLYQQSLAIIKEKLGDNHPYVASSLNNLAELYSLQGRYREAKPLFQQSLAIRKKKLGDNHPDVATSLNGLALLYKSQERYTKAESLYQQSLAIWKEKLGDNHPDVATSLNNLAELYRLQGRYTKSESLYQQSLSITKEKLGDNHPDVATSLNNLAGLYYSQGNTISGVGLLSQGLEVEERNLSKNLIAGDERQKQDYMSKISGITDAAVSLNLQSAPNNLEATRLGLKTIFQRKGRILDVLTNSLQILRQRIDDPKTQELLNQLITKGTQLSNLIFKKAEYFPDSKVYRELLTNAETEVKGLEDELSRHSAEFRNLSQPITLEKIQQQIPADTALVELVRYQPVNLKTPQNERFGKPRYAAYILYQTGEPQAIDLGEAEPIDKTVEKLRKYLRNSKVPLEQLQRSARKLDEMVMQPVRQLLGETKTILLSPDAALNLIPFEALVDENNQYLVENYQITYLTSGRDLLRQNPKNNRQTPLVIANPKYEQQGEIVTLDNYRSIDLSDRVFLPLGGTQVEAETISQLFPEALMLTKTKATENALKQVKNPDFLHIATHGFFLSKPKSENSTDIDNPLFRSGLVFAGVEKQQSGGDDGVFTAYEATLLNLVGTQLVVLSACDTGIGDISAGEGIYGLRRAFVIAGSESQMMSLWKVEDEATKDLMVAYYQGLKAGKGRRDALLDIQRDWLQEGEYQHPYYWASFIFSGDSTPIELNSKVKS
ncbi:MAG: tetratricopeptide repeat protein [Okeania sp. SIO3B5]|uniref:tetratricopeptide repeat protein n=1 Tax=Okeania sp. SIO3B5 TaxID=2607811 RepID=UPI0014009828|nr:tetratricopeptide repeat protein [Okeania sp. SIO3B5]NEO55845.1 tetratricopeptide repeat protein [Okeania sp. SIO3B5]